MITGSTKLSAKELNAIFFYSNVYFLNKHTEPLLLTKVFSSSKFHGIIFHWHIAFRQLTKIQLQHIDEYDLDSITLLQWKSMRQFLYYINTDIVGNQTKGLISKRVLQESKVRSISRKNDYFIPADTRTYVCVSGVNVHFSEN